jgi:hypothetical protein
MKNFYKSIFCLNFVLFSPLILASQNDYDGKWNVEFTCSVNSKNQRPGFSYSEVWNIKNNSIHHTYKTTTKFGAEQTLWNGQISNHNISLKANANRDNGDTWSWVGQGMISSPEAFQIIAIMNDKSGAKIRDCVIKFELIDAAVGSLGYLKAHQQKPIQKREPALKLKEIAPLGLSTEIKRAADTKEDHNKKPKEELGKDAPTVQAQESNVEPKPAPVISSEIDYQQYLIAIGVILLLLVIGIILIRTKKDSGSDQSRKLQDELRSKAEAQGLMAMELEKDKKRLEQLERELKEKEVSLAQQAQYISSEAEKTQPVTTKTNIFMPTVELALDKIRASSKKIRVIGTCVIIVLITFFFYRPNIELTKIDPIQQLGLKEGIKYHYWPGGNAAGTAKSTETMVYLQEPEYEKLCKASQGVSKGGASGLALLDSKGFYLLNNGKLDKLTFSWSSDTGRKYRCRVHLTVSGNYQGSSTRVDVEGGADEFILNNEGKLLISSASLFNN